MNQYSVICQVCHNEFDSIFPYLEDENSFTQGDGCACSIFERSGQWVLQGYYGSIDYDGAIYNFHNIPQTDYQNADPICDNCVKVLIDQNWVYQVTIKKFEA